MLLSASLTRRPQESCNKSDIAPRSWWWLWNICGEWHLPERPISSRLSLLYASHRCICWWQVLHFWCFVNSSGRLEVRYALAFHAEILWLSSTLMRAPSIKSYIILIVLCAENSWIIHNWQGQDSRPAAGGYSLFRNNWHPIFLRKQFVVLGKLSFFLHQSLWNALRIFIIYFIFELAQALKSFFKGQISRKPPQKNSGIWTTPAGQTRFTHARTTVSAYCGNFTAKLLVASLLNRSQAS